VSEFWLWSLALVATAVAALARSAFFRASSGSAVDHYYWLLAARAYREGKRLPVSIPNKYLLEDERQCYPPFLGWLLARLPESWLSGVRPVALVQAADAATLLLLIAHALHLNAPAASIVVIFLVYGLAPVLAAYNTQLSSRSFGNLFFTASLLSQAAASALPSDAPKFILGFAVAIVATAAVILTHKMTTQLMIALWPLWPFALGDARIAFILPTGLILSVLITGPRFAAMQWRAHADIVAFWHRHRDALGAHVFAHSPIYGDPSRVGETAFHKPGWDGWRAHGALAFGYCPLLWLAPLTLVAAPPPPAWILIWTIGVAMVALLTLYVPILRCFGGGHLYIFNAIAPAALWWATVVAHGTSEVLAIFGLGLLATLLALVWGHRRRLQGHSRADEGFQAVIDHLSKLPPGRVAVFPLTAAEEVAYRTPQAVLWGAHGYGFCQLEPIFPVMRERLSTVLRQHRCDWLLFDVRYWPGGPEVVSAEFPHAHVVSFASWNLVTLPRVHDTHADEPGLRKSACSL